MENDLAENLVSWTEDSVNWLIKQVVVEANDKHWKNLLRHSVENLAQWLKKNKEEIETESKDEKDEDKKDFSITSVDVKGELNKIISLERIKNLINCWHQTFRVS